MNHPKVSRQSPMLLLVAVLLFAGSSAFAQQPPSPNPPPPNPAGDQAEKPKSGADPQDAKDPPKNDPKEKPKGRSKLEQETGTVNDRIFEVMPNYGMVEGKKELPALTPN